MTTSSIAPPAVYLVALDMSDAADHVLEVACDLGAALGGAAELHLVHILPDQSVDPVLLMGGGALPVDYRKGGEALLERTAARAAQRFRGKIIGHLAMGEPAKRIVGSPRASTSISWSSEPLAAPAWNAWRSAPSPSRSCAMRPVPSSSCAPRRTTW